MKTKKLFSLLELIIVLSILAILASMLLENFADSKLRQSEELTMTKGNSVKEIITPKNTDRSISKFLSDTGRWPSVYIPDGGDGDGGRRLAELYDRSIWFKNESGSENAFSHYETISSDDIGYIIRNAAGSTFPANGSYIYLPYPQVSMAVGWNGPYLGIAQTANGKFFDGWGNPWKIISNYNLLINNNHLVENYANDNRIKIHASAAEINSLLNKGENRRTRIDGIISYGANDTADNNNGVSPSDADMKFLFQHNMDNHISSNTATLNVRLKIKDGLSNDWVPLPEISAWSINTRYHKGAFTVFSDSRKLYYCHTAHTSGGSFDSSKFYSVSDTSEYNPAVHGTNTFSGLCLFNDTYYVRINNNAEGAFNPANWEKVAPSGVMYDSISLLIFLPVMQGSYDQRFMKLGYLHFFRNSRTKNDYGVKPLFGPHGSADIDCEGDTTTIYNANDQYNKRYLIAEDRSGTKLNIFSIARLIPGRRKIYCTVYNSNAKRALATQVEWVDLAPGDNHITLYLERTL